MPKKIKRRDFLKATAVGGAGFALGMTPFQIKTKGDIDRLYDKSIVIDTLCVGHDWDSEELDALDKSGYTGIQTSLANRTWDSALKSIAEWNDRIDANPEVFLKATKASHFRQAKKEDKVAVLYGHQNATMIDNKIDRLDILHDLGTRCIQLTYNSRNLLGDGCTERTNAGSVSYTHLTLPTTPYL